jgi:hypothetical protein
VQVPIPSPGSFVWIRQRRWRVERARLDRRVVRLDVANDHDRLTFLVPFDRPVAAGSRRGPRQVRSGQALAWLAGLAARHGGVRTPMTALAADVALLPHQFDAVLAMLGGARRVLVADEAGLGKTIQAGLVLAEVLAREPSPRALIVVRPSIDHVRAPSSGFHASKRGSPGSRRFQTSCCTVSVRRRICHGCDPSARVNKSPFRIESCSPGIPMMRLMKLFERSSGYLNTTISKRSGSR